MELMDTDALRTRTCHTCLAEGTLKCPLESDAEGKALQADHHLTLQTRLWLTPQACPAP